MNLLTSKIAFGFFSALLVNIGSKLLDFGLAKQSVPL